MHRKVYIMKKVLFFAMAMLIALPLMAAPQIPVMVIDSGTDFSHPIIAPVADADKAELNGKPGVDDSGSGFADDIYGWNFVKNTGELVELADTPDVYDDLLEFMRCMGIYQEKGKEGMTAEDFNFLVKKYKDQKFMGWVNFIGGWSHGTHVGGIMSENNDKIKMKAITHIPSGQAPEREVQAILNNFNAYLMLDAPSSDEDVSLYTDNKNLQDNPIMPQLIEYFKNMGREQAAQIAEKAKYIGKLKPRVINCSFGTSNGALLKMFEQNMAQWGFENPSAQDIQDMVNIFVSLVQLEKDKVFFKYVPQALIVIAAGNSTEDNDKLVISPNDAPFDNKLVVAATNHDLALAGFSCYGKTKVDIATPGVNIYSSYPNGQMGYMSGTSMAAPLASRYASLVLAANPGLTALELKEILMKTVDKKDFLKGKVVSEGVINVDRAVAAAKNMKKGMSLKEAVETAAEKVPALMLDGPVFRAPQFESDFEKALYNSAVF
jgi:subtilisin family serine protease